MIKIPMEFQYFLRIPSASRLIFVIRPKKYQQLRFQEFRMIKIPIFGIQLLVGSFAGIARYVSPKNIFSRRTVTVRVFCWDNVNNTYGISILLEGRIGAGLIFLRNYKLFRDHDFKMSIKPTAFQYF